MLLVMAAVVAAVLLWLPFAVTRRRHGGGRVAGRWRLFVYFASIGLAFMLVEVSMIQRFALLLGFPTLSLSVSLFTLLIATAIGARYSAIVLRWPRTGLPTVVLLLAVIAIAYLFARRSADRSRAGVAAMGPDRPGRGAAAADRPAARRVPADGHDGGRRARSGSGSTRDASWRGAGP